MKKMIDIGVCTVVIVVCVLLMLCFGIESVAGIISVITGVLSVLFVIIQAQHDEREKAEEKIEKISEELLTDKGFLRIERVLNDYTIRYLENRTYNESPILNVEHDIHAFGLKIGEKEKDRAEMERFIRKLNELARRIESAPNLMNDVDDEIRKIFFLTVNNPVVQKKILFANIAKYSDLLELSDSTIKTGNKQFEIPLTEYGLTHEAVDASAWQMFDN